MTSNNAGIQILADPAYQQGQTGPSGYDTLGGVLIVDPNVVSGPVTITVTKMKGTRILLAPQGDHRIRLRYFARGKIA